MLAFIPAAILEGSAFFPGYERIPKYILKYRNIFFWSACVLKCLADRKLESSSPPMLEPVFSVHPDFPDKPGLGCFPNCAVNKEVALILVNSLCSEMFWGTQTNWHRMFYLIADKKY